ncbi:MAG: CPBP family intramembrane metalloprotease [Eubacteriales bacterium]|nr:CPBP family intramembrane metalloprotease [Eubacteriales bacterium]
MSVSGKQLLALLWRLVYPLLLYEAVMVFISLEAAAVIGQETENTALAVLGWSAAAAFVPLCFIYRRARRREGKGLNAGRRPRRLLLAALAGAGACVFLNQLLWLLPVDRESFGQARQVLYRPELWVQILCTGLMIPLTEELVFRGLGFWRLRRNMGFWGAAVISALWFGLFHGNLVQGIYACIVGMMLAAVFEWTDSLSGSWAFHSAANLTSVLLTAWSADDWLAAHGLWGAAAAAFGGCLAAAALLKIYRFRKTDPAAGRI